MCNRLVLACAMLLLLCSVAACLGADPSNPPQGITVTGTAEVQGKPDTAYVTLGVQTEDRVAAKAAQDNASKNTLVINAIVKTGVGKLDIQTVGYSVAPKVDYKANPPTTVGYTVSNEVRVKVRDLDKVGAVIDAALASGANYSQNLVFAIDDDTQLRQEALAKAARNAEAKAKAIAEALGVKLGVPMNVIEGGAQGPVMPLMRAMAVEAAPASTPIMPGENRISASVTVLFAVQYGR